jgi:cytochrome c553
MLFVTPRTLAWAALFALAVAISHAGAEDRVGFNRDVRPILSDKCFFCHGPDANKRQADLRLDERETAVKAGAIAPGKPDASGLVRRVLSEDPDERMPPASSKLGRLTAQEVATLRRWIEQGAEYEGHWAFIPLKPLAAGANPVALVDQFVAQGLAKRKLSPQPEADRATLIRRLSFDLIGLPPTPAEVEAFLADERPDAYERLVDRLLQSPHYGERMAVDWLDVARYADSFGFQVDREREMWPWRDWVVRAFNQNLPFDQFITWQLAGDLLPHATDDQILATAFNRLHQQESEGGSVEEEYRVEYVCDRVQTFATAFLGLTFECARCHDHKFDPVPTTDYYALAGIFTSTELAAGLRNQMGGAGLAYYVPAQLVRLGGSCRRPTRRRSSGSRPRSPRRKRPGTRSAARRRG